MFACIKPNSLCFFPIVKERGTAVKSLCIEPNERFNQDSTRSKSKSIAKINKIVNSLIGFSNSLALNPKG